MIIDTYGFSTNDELATILGEGLLRNNREGLRHPDIAALSHYEVLHGKKRKRHMTRRLATSTVGREGRPDSMRYSGDFAFNGRINKAGKVHTM